jgi:hypothetical protein
MAHLDMQRDVRRALGRSAALTGLAAAALCLVGCLSEQLSARSPQSFGGVLADRATCEGRYVRSIWKGEDVSGPECSAYAAYAGHAPEYDGGRIQRVCEHAEIRTILTGESATLFTLQACSRHRDKYQQATISKTCRSVSRAQTQELTPAQSAACKEHLRPPSLNAPAPASAAIATAFAPAAPRESGFASVPDTGVAAAPERSSYAPVDRDTCEDRYVESIWKGRDVNGGSECAAYVRNDGSAPEYNRDRIQSICEGAEIRAQRTGQALKSFSQQACAPLRGTPLASAPVPSVRAASAGPPGSEAGAPAHSGAEPEPTPVRTGLSEAEIASTVDAHWRWIGRDCASVAPRSSSASAPENIQASVTLTVAPSGLVRNASARAGGRHDLEACIESSVRSWRFPPAEVGTVVGIPLMFAGQ